MHNNHKSWFFSNNKNGSCASALICSLAVTACENGLNVKKYFYRQIISDKPVALE